MGSGLLSAQAPPPNPHWGTSIYPPQHPELRATLAFHRFTEMDGSGNQFNGIQETAGFNLLTLSWTDEVVDARWPRLSYTFDVGAGVSADQPTEFLQNDYLHALRGLNPVPVGSQRDEAEFLGGLSVYTWFGHGERVRGHQPESERALWLEGFAGGGFSTSTMYQEGFVQAGGSVYISAIDTRLSILDRAAWPHEGNAIPNVSSFSNLFQCGVTWRRENFYLGESGTVGDLIDSVFRVENLLPWNWPGALHDVLARPAIGLWLTHDSGLFMSTSGQPIDIWFGSFRVDWGTGLRLETWNDILNGTDFGPSFGLLLSFDLMTLFGQ